MSKPILIVSICMGKFIRIQRVTIKIKPKNYVIYFTHAKKRRQPWALYKARLICIVIWGSLTGQRYVDQVLNQHVLQIYQTVGNNFLFQQDNASIPTIWQGTVLQAGHVIPTWLAFLFLIHLGSATLGIFYAVFLQDQNFWGSLMTPCLKIWGSLANLEG